MKQGTQLNGLPSAALIRKNDRNGPRYTSYPTALQFHTGFGPRDHVAAAARAGASNTPLSLYVHVPFCASPCFYCACTKVITSRPERAETYLSRLRQEIGLQASLFDKSRIVEQLHFGGGTPTFLSGKQLSTIFDALHDGFTLSNDARREFSIEIDPRTIEPGTMPELAALGFNRASFGIQDFDPAVQHAVNRIQTPALVASLMDAARDAGFGSLSADLIYGLPLQTLRSFDRTLDQVIALRPDRISAYSYAHMPGRFKPQRQIPAEQLPDAAAKLELLLLITGRLLDAGYLHIGMDHFALPADELAQALRRGSLQRNFQGYSTRSELDLLGLGMSAISRIGDAYSQNARTLKEYYAALDDGRLPVERGIRLSQDDRVRRDVIASIMCGGELSYADMGMRHHLDFRHYFSVELRHLAELEADGLVELQPDRLRVTPTGRYLLRAIAMPFDAYLQTRGNMPADAVPRYSRVI